MAIGARDIARSVPQLMVVTRKTGLDLRVIRIERAVQALVSIGIFEDVDDASDIFFKPVLVKIVEKAFFGGDAVGAPDSVQAVAWVSHGYDLDVTGFLYDLPLFQLSVITA
jgi:hypothetical protein